MRPFQKTPAHHALPATDPKLPCRSPCRWSLLFHLYGLAPHKITDRPRTAAVVRALPCKICPIVHPSIPDWIMHHQMPGSNTSFNWWRKRSEEHTSELQSLMRISYAVFCLKKKTQKTK